MLLRKCGLILSVIELHVLMLFIPFLIGIIVPLLMLLMLLMVMEGFLLDRLPVLRTRAAHCQFRAVIVRLRCVVGRHRKRRGKARR